jgi:hypothetical protein
MRFGPGREWRTSQQGKKKYFLGEPLLLNVRAFQIALT